MKSTTLAAALISSSLLLFSCGDSTPKAEETKLTPEQTEQAEESIQKMDEVSKELDQKEADLDKALEDLGI